MKIKYKGYDAVQKSKMVHISKDGVVESTMTADKDCSAKELRTLINKHIKEKVGETDVGR